MKKYCLDLKVLSATHVSDKHVLLKLTSNHPLPSMRPGQFVEVRIDGSPSTFLRRPISINYVDEAANELWLLIAAIGDGTRHLYNLSAGATLNCLLPLGNGFSDGKAINAILAEEDPSHHISTSSNGKSSAVLLIGGGVGVAPLLWQGKQLKASGIEPVFLLGARSAADLLELDLFKAIGLVCITTEDGSAGERGFVTNHSVLQKNRFSMIQTCGPKPMMQAVARFARERGIACEASLENMMACGLGACLCCVEKTTEGNERVCEDGPVFNIKKLLW